MSENEIRTFADQADVIINGYAISKGSARYSILNLNHPDRAAVFSDQMDLLETNMNDIELEIVKGYLCGSLKYMED